MLNIAEAIEAVDGIIESLRDCASSDPKRFMHLAALMSIKDFLETELETKSGSILNQ